ncbi:MAG: exo-alpha-sialidase [Pseudomonadales bacterium]|nr:exo-alpha-sialidase [Pseudomonadales bacterium]
MAKIFVIALTLVISACTSVAKPHADKPEYYHCEASSHTEADVRCAKTVSAAVAQDGRIWFAWAVKNHLYVNYSDDKGKTYSKPVRVNPEAEKIATRGENRPKIALDKAGNIYLSWANPLPQKWSSNIRFAWSADAGKHFSQAVTINDDGLMTGHSFNEMVVSDDGQVFITWLDGRHALKAKQAGAITDHEYIGSAIYMASSKPAAGESAWKNRHLLDGSCVCCRLALDLNPQQQPVLMWRHIYADNIRDHALLTLTDSVQKPAPHRVSFENWQIEGCPHQGPAVRVQGQRTHMAWFNDAPEASGLFYAYSDSAGQKMSKVLPFAKRETGAVHPHLAITPAGKVLLLWQEYDGSYQRLKYMQSDNGEQWTETRQLAQHEGVTDYPSVITHPEGNLLLWHKPGYALELIEVN